MTEHDPRLEKLLQAGAPRSFAPGFADRVMRRLAEEAAPFDALLLRQFRWLAAAATLAAVVLGAYSVLVPEPYAEQSLVEAALGLAPVSVESAYSLDATLYELSSTETGGTS